MDPTTKRRLGRTALSVTQLGLGSAALGNLFRVVPKDEALAVVREAFAAGIRTFDTAPYYGHGLSERRMGSVLRGLPRADYVLSTKVGRVLEPLRGRPLSAVAHTGYVEPLPFEPVFDYTRDGVMRSFESSLERLGVERIDVLLLHDLGRMTHGDRHAAYFRDAMSGGYRALDELRRAGTIGAIGLGVNEIEVCLEAMEHGDFDCFLLAGRYTLLEQRALDDLFPRCVERGISIVLGGPYNSGLLTGRPRAGATWNYAPAPQEVLDRAVRLHEVCRSHGVALEAAALQFPLYHPAVATVIPGSRSVAELRSNLAHFATEIPPALWRDLKSEGLVRRDAPAGV